MRVAFTLLLVLVASCQPKDAAPADAGATPAMTPPTPPPASSPGAAPTDAGVDPTASVAADAGEEMSLVPKRLRKYLACGCGCCPDANVADRKIQKCVYREKGETLEAVRDKDEEAKKDPSCATAGCSQGILYGYCG